MASSSLTLWKALDQRFDVGETLTQYLPQLRETFPQLSAARSCAMIGCGYGYLDLEFVRECLPNVTELAAVEPDADQMAELKNRVAKLFPTATVEFFQETAQGWKGAGKPFQVVLLFHCLYYVPQSERPALFQRLFDSVVTSGGHVFILVNPCTSSANPPCLVRLNGLLGVQNDPLDGDRVYDMMTSVGFSDCYQLHINSRMEAGELDDFVSLYRHWSGGKLSPQVIRKAAKQVFGSKKTVPHDNWFGVFRKP